MVPERMFDDVLTDMSPQKLTAFTGIFHWISCLLIHFLPSFHCFSLLLFPDLNPPVLCMFVCFSYLFSNVFEWCDGISPN